MHTELKTIPFASKIKLLDGCFLGGGGKQECCKIHKFSQLITDGQSQKD